MHLRWHGQGNDAIAGAAAGDAVESPRAGDGDERDGIDVAMCLKVNISNHVEGNERRGVTLSMHVGLVAGNVGVVDNGRVVNDGVEHGRRGEAGGVGL